MTKIEENLLCVKRGVHGGDMRTIDLTHEIHEGMVVYPGSDQPKLRAASNFEESGYRERKILMSSHTGTHIDAPAHMLDDGNFLDDYDVARFHGIACVYDHSLLARREIEVSDLNHLESVLATSQFLLIHTGWSDYWGESRYLEGFPTLSPEAAEWLTGFGLSGVGLDVISADPIDSCDFPVHRILFEADQVIIENLKGLCEITSSTCLFSCLPLKIEKADGSPVRAVAIVDTVGASPLMANMTTG